MFGKSVKKNVDWFEANSITLIPLVNEKRTALFAYKPIQVLATGKVCEWHAEICEQRRGDVPSVIG